MRDKRSESTRRLEELAAVARARAALPTGSSPISGGWLPAPEADLVTAPAADQREASSDAPAEATWPAAMPGGADAPVARLPRTVRPAAAAAVAALAVVVVVVVWTRSVGAADVVELAPRPAVDSPAGAARGSIVSPAATVPISSSAGVAAGASTVVVVDVEGRVRRPGLQRLPVGSRVADALRAAGGTTAGALAGGLNLARVLGDGEQLIVPGPGAPSPAPAPDGSPAGSGAGPTGGGAGAGAGGTPGGAPVDLNTATQDGLDALPGIGPVLAQRIVTWRAQHGRFSSVDELAEVAGIGPKVLERLRPLVRV